MLIRRRLFERWCGLWMMIWIHHRGAGGAHYILQRICCSHHQSTNNVCEDSMDSSRQHCNAIVLIWYSIRKTVFLFLFNVIPCQLFWCYIPQLLLFQLISRARVLPTPIYGVRSTYVSSFVRIIGIRSNSDFFFFSLQFIFSSFPLQLPAEMQICTPYSIQTARKEQSGPPTYRNRHGSSFILHPSPIALFTRSQ